MRACESANQLIRGRCADSVWYTVAFKERINFNAGLFDRLGCWYLKKWKAAAWTFD